jgi:type I restriction enzyme, R subunit
LSAFSTSWKKTLAFDSDEINAIVKDLGLLKVLFKNKMEQKAPLFLKLVTHGLTTKTWTT